MTAPLTPTPLSEAVARLTHYLSAGLLDTYGVGSMQEHPRLTAEEALEHDIQRLLDAVAECREDRDRLDWLVRHHVEVRSPARYGSWPLFVAQVASDVDEAFCTSLREQIDAARSVAPPPAPTEPGADGGNDA